MNSVKNEPTIIRSNSPKGKFQRDSSIDELISQIVVNVAELERLILNPTLANLTKVSDIKSGDLNIQTKIKKENEKSNTIQLKIKSSEPSKINGKRNSQEKSKEKKKKSKKRKKSIKDEKDYEVSKRKEGNPIVKKEFPDQSENIDDDDDDDNENIKNIRERDLKLLKIIGASGWHSYILVNRIYQHMIDSNEFPGETIVSLKLRVCEVVKNNFLNYDISDDEKDKYFRDRALTKEESKENLPTINLDYLDYEL